MLAANRVKRFLDEFFVDCPRVEFDGFHDRGSYQSLRFLGERIKRLEALSLRSYCRIPYDRIGALGRVRHNPFRLLFGDGLRFPDDGDRFAVSRGDTYLSLGLNLAETPFRFFGTPQSEFDARASFGKKFEKRAVDKGGKDPENHKKIDSLGEE